MTTLIPPPRSAQPSMQSRDLRARLIATSIALAALLAPGCGKDSPVTPPGPSGPRPYLGISANADAFDPPDSIISAILTARATGAELIYQFSPWSSFEQGPGNFGTDELEPFFAGVQSVGFRIVVNFALINTTVRETPADLNGLAWNDPVLLARFDTALDSLLSVMERHDCMALAIGNEVDAYFATHASEFPAYLELVGRGVRRAHAAIPGLAVGVTTISPVRSTNAAWGAQLNDSTDVAIYTYYPFQFAQDFQVMPAATLDADFDAMSASSPSRPWALQEIGYPSATSNGSSPAQQAEFMRRFQSRMARESRDRLLFANWFLMSDWSSATVWDLVTYYGGGSTPGFVGFLGSLGLRDTLGNGKPAWNEWKSGPWNPRLPRD
ncbi:MAG: hypothetical protein HOP12_14045 [Candidatus Eisenbacteria bacterium]|uniref:Glycoside hydrolase family 5 domain-containing protein n=1 Tax=Eiseniibacteriota bacterium TaxID=2212470 RepID=A0A849SLF5_UNCEI|nr:hypothetical protein [Candidatus Eisenbacteria bacterium]